jgi:hypothetical protein
VVSTTPRPLYPRERPGTHCTGGWVGPRAGLDVCEKSLPTGIRSPDHPARSQSLYRLSYPFHKELTIAIGNIVPLQDRCRHFEAKLNLFLLQGIEPRFLGCPSRILVSIPSRISAVETQIRNATLYKSHSQKHNPSVDRSHTARLVYLIRKVIE